MRLGLLGQAVGMFAATNVDDLVVLALFFGQATGRRGAARVVAGQYLGFGAILVASVVGALGAWLLPPAVIPCLGLLPLLLGLRAAWHSWRRHRDDEQEAPVARPGVLTVAAVTVANGGDNIGGYVPVFATAGSGTLIMFVIVFLVLVAVWCLAGRFLATRPVIARALARWGQVLLPLVLIGIGSVILLRVG